MENFLEKVLTAKNGSSIIEVETIKIKIEKEKMKSLKDHKVQILAALALAFSLGMVVPSTTFAMAGDDGINAQSAEQVTADISADQLLAVIKQATGNTNYTKYANLVNGYNGIAATNPADGAVATAVSAVKAIDTVSDLTASSDIATVKARIEAMDAYKTWGPVVNAINEIVQETGVANASAITAASLGKFNGVKIAQYYNTINNVVNPMPTTYAENIVTLAGRIANGGAKSYMTYQPVIEAAIALEAKPDDTKLLSALMTAATTAGVVSGSTDLTAAALLTQVKTGIEDYDKYVALYNSMAFIREALPEGTTDISKITMDLLNQKYPTVDGKNPLAEYYDAMGRAAKAIDATVMNNLMPVDLPETSAGGTAETDSKLNTPNTGIVGLFENGALDLGTITLIVSVAVASIAGVGVVARLYLRKKF